MNITVNGDRRQISEQTSLNDLLQELELFHQSLAVAINQEVVPRSRFAETQLRADDQVDLVRAVGGG